MAYLEMINVCKGFGSGLHRTEVLANVHLAVERNEFVAVIGYSGSGKSTMMNLLAGLEKPDTGEVRMDGRRVTGPSPQLGIVFQNYSLLPWFSVFGNIELAVRNVFRRMPSEERRQYVQHYIEVVGLTGSEHKKPRELSGGMRQRLSLARTLAMKPEVLLLDEPLSALDALTRSVLQDELIRIWEQDRRTVVMITNDVDEATLMADRIIPLTPGPNSTLAQAFKVGLVRPRDRTTLNFNPKFRKLRNDVTQNLLSARDQSGRSATPTFTLPDIKPVDMVRAG